MQRSSSNSRLESSKKFPFGEHSFTCVKLAVQFRGQKGKLQGYDVILQPQNAPPVPECPYIVLTTGLHAMSVLVIWILDPDLHPEVDFDNTCQVCSCFA